MGNENTVEVFRVMRGDNEMLKNMQEGLIEPKPCKERQSFAQYLDRMAVAFLYVYPLGWVHFGEMLLMVVRC